MLEGYMTTTEAAKFLDFNSDYVGSLCKKGELPGATKFGKSWAIPEQSVYGYEKGGQGFAAEKERRQKENATLLATINAAIRAGKNLATA